MEALARARIHQRRGPLLRPHADLAQQPLALPCELPKVTPVALLKHAPVKHLHTRDAQFGRQGIAHQLPRLGAPGVQLGEHVAGAVVAGRKGLLSQRRKAAPESSVDVCHGIGIVVQARLRASLGRYSLTPRKAQHDPVEPFVSALRSPSRVAFEALAPEIQIGLAISQDHRADTRHQQHPAAALVIT